MTQLLKLSGLTPVGDTGSLKRSRGCDQCWYNGWKSHITFERKRGLYSKQLAPWLDNRQQLVLRQAHFFELYKEELHTLFCALGREMFWSDDPRNLIEYTG